MPLGCQKIKQIPFLQDLLESLRGSHAALKGAVGWLCVTSRVISKHPAGPVFLELLISHLPPCPSTALRPFPYLSRQDIFLFFASISPPFPPFST